MYHDEIISIRVGTRLPAQGDKVAADCFVELRLDPAIVDSWDEQTLGKTFKTAVKTARAYIDRKIGEAAAPGN